MSIDFQALRLDGIYQMNPQDDLMLRVKIPAGVLSSEQAEKIAEIGERFGQGMLHLTSRGSVEFHWLRVEQLGRILPMLAAVGLTTRGACGGAVRGISCSTSFGPGFARVQGLARRLHRHFAGNPHFEGLPKKFKIAVEADYRGARHLIQDLAIVRRDEGADGERFDVWCAGGLGREPQPAFCYARDLDEAQLLPLVEAVIRVYARDTPAGKRLKHLLREIGEETFRARVAERLDQASSPALRPSVAGALVEQPAALLEVPVFAGELPATHFRTAARLARTYGDGFLALTADQNLAFPLAEADRREALREALRADGMLPDGPTLNCRACPGNHECRMGLAPTRELARELEQRYAGGALGEASFAISGCPNACSQPQLAEIGIVTRKLVRDADGGRTPRFDLLRRRGDGFGESLASDLDRAGLFAALDGLKL